MSASKGHHRKRGNLSILLEAATRGDFRNKRTVLTVEAMDRLFREGVLEVFPILSQLIDNNIVVVTGDFTIWCRASINSSRNFKLIAEINAAREYAARLADFATGAHSRRRRVLVALADDDTAQRPKLNGRTPGWLTKVVTNVKGSTHSIHTYDPHPIHSPTLISIFEMCASGMTVRQITDHLNETTATPLGGNVGPWKAPRVGAVLRDRHVLGLYTPSQHIGGDRVPAGPEVRVYPPIIGADLWLRTQEVLTGRRTLVGRRGKELPNLFTRRVSCRTCGGAMRVDTGGGIRRGRRQRSLICAAFVESKTCNDRTRYDLHHFERLLLIAILQITQVAPTGTAPDVGKLTEELAATRVRIARRLVAMAALADAAGEDADVAALVLTMGREIGGWRKAAADLQLKIEAIASLSTRAEDAHRFIQSTIGPAISGDIGARDRLRTLMSKLDFRIEGMHDGGMAVSSGDHRIECPPEWAFAADQDDHR